MMAEAAPLEIRQIPEQVVAFAAGEGSYLAAEQLLDRVRSWTVTIGVAMVGPSAIVFPEPPESDPEAAGTRVFEVWAPIEREAATTADDPVQVKHIPATRAAVRVVSGPYDPLQLPAVYTATEALVRQAGYQANGDPRLVYDEDPARVQRGEDLVVQLVFPIA